MGDKDHKIIAMLERIEQFLLKNGGLPEKEFLDSEQAARYLGISRNTLYKYTSRRLFATSNPNGKLIRISKSELDKFLSSNKRKSNDDLNSEASI
jgi:excisionase family DNA binding protein